MSKNTTSSTLNQNLKLTTSDSSEPTKQEQPEATNLPVSGPLVTPTVTPLVQLVPILGTQAPVQPTPDLVPQTAIIGQLMQAPIPAPTPAPTPVHEVVIEVAGEAGEAGAEVPDHA